MSSNDNFVSLRIVRFRCFDMTRMRVIYGPRIEMCRSVFLLVAQSLIRQSNSSILSERHLDYDVVDWI
ncbi:MAG: hypothetical protein JWM11_4995 [Planctomycetaceae bacterium]|nr:hypothetical protein [Planctomycetaceae bacterium]